MSHSDSGIVMTPYSGVSPATGSGNGTGTGTGTGSGSGSGGVAYENYLLDMTEEEQLQLAMELSIEGKD